MCLIPLYGLYPCLRAAEDILSMSSHEPYGATASCLRWFCLKKQKNTLCTSCFHSLHVVLDTKCSTAPALSCTRIPMRHTSLCDCRTLLLHRLPCISFTINLRKSCSIFFHKNSHLPLKRYMSSFQLPVPSKWFTTKPELMA